MENQKYPGNIGLYRVAAGHMFSSKQSIIIAVYFALQRFELSSWTDSFLFL